MDHLDVEFDEIIAEIASLLDCAYIVYVGDWIVRLQKELGGCVEDKMNRNVYAKYLNMMILEENIRWPFNHPPPECPLAPFHNIVDPQEFAGYSSPEESIIEATDDEQPTGRSKKAPMCQNIRAMKDAMCKSCEPPPNPCKKRNGDNNNNKRKEAWRPKNKVDKICEIASNVNEFTVLDEFLNEVAKYTADNGDILFETTDEILEDFRMYAHNVYDDRQVRISNMLHEKLQELKNKYEEWENRILSKCEPALKLIEEIIPGFNFEQYLAERDYVYNQVKRKDIENELTVCRERGKKLNEEGRYREMFAKMADQRLKFLNERLNSLELDNSERRKYYDCIVHDMQEAVKDYEKSNKKRAACTNDLKKKIKDAKKSLQEYDNLINKLQHDVESLKKSQEDDFDHYRDPCEGNSCPNPC